jgi:uncharacterized protein YdhG (YjbR/CyaY superfamily)
MKVESATIEEYISKLPVERKDAFVQLFDTVAEHIPEGFEPVMSYGMVGFVVPHSIYPEGYHCNTKLPLPFINLANQKNFVALYHMGLYASPKLMKWFVSAYAETVSTKLDMGKSCIRFKRPDQIPFELIGQLVGKLTTQDWIDLYEVMKAPSK